MAQTNSLVTSATEVLSIEHTAISRIRSHPPSERSATADEVSVAFFDNEVPAFLEPELERLYQSIYSTLARLSIYEGDRAVSSYVARRGAEVISVILFRLEGSRLVVLNQQVVIDSIETERFSRAIFSRYRSVNRVSFWGLMPTASGAVPYPSRRDYCLPEVVVALPESADDYLSSLGKSTRRGIRSSLKKVKATFPSFRTEVREKDRIDSVDIFDIIHLNNARMVVKDKVSYNSDVETRRLALLANAYGLVLTLKIDGRTCAGAIGYCVGSTCFFHTLAHDPKFDEFKLGMVCCYLMMCECIARGIKTVRFGGSTHRYKFDFRGSLLYLDQLTLYRHTGHYLLHAPRAFPTSLSAFMGKAKLWILLAERREDHASRVIARCMSRLREFRRSDKPPLAENDNPA